jgi:hypothetical protein
VALSFLQKQWFLHYHQYKCYTLIKKMLIV